MIWFNHGYIKSNVIKPATVIKHLLCYELFNYEVNDFKEITIFCL